MFRHHRHRARIRGRWHGLHGAIWMIGLGILAWHGWWWPGMLVLIGISMILESTMAQPARQTFEETRPPQASPPPPSTPPQPFSQAPAVSGHRIELLPQTCSRCGGPIRGHEVKWTGPQSAACPYCGSNLSMKKI